MAEFKLERKTLPPTEDDAFQDFREIALLEFHHQFDYRHSLGKTSKFFLALEEGKLLATKCEACGSVYMPPRAVCPKDLNVTEWLELSGKGTLESWTLCPYPPSYAQTETPYILAYVRLEGTSSLFLHQLRKVSVDDLRYGLKVKVAFAQSAVRHPLDYIWFEVSN